MNILYIIVMTLLFILTIIYYFKFQKILKINSDLNFRNENKMLSQKNSELLSNYEKYEKISIETIEKLQNVITTKEQEIQNLKNEFDINMSKYKTEIFTLKDEFLIEKERIYHQGIAKGIERSNYRIEIHPYQEIKQVKKLLGSEDVLNVGYKYIMFMNDTPTAYSHIEIFETVSKKEIDEEKVNKLLSRISDVSSIIPNGNVKLVGNIAEFGKTILNFKK